MRQNCREKTKLGVTVTRSLVPITLDDLRRSRSACRRRPGRTLCAKAGYRGAVFRKALRRCPVPRWRLALPGQKERNQRPRRMELSTRRVQFACSRPGADPRSTSAIRSLGYHPTRQASSVGALICIGRCYTRTANPKDPVVELCARRT